MSEEKRKTVGEIVLAGIMVKPQRLEAFEFVDSMFEDRQARETFAFIAAEWEDKKPEEIDIELIRAAGHEDVANYLAGLQGWEPINDEQFGIYFRRFQEGQVKKSLIRKLDTLARSKMDIEDDDVDELRSDFEALAKLNRVGQVFDPDKVLMTGTEMQTMDIHVDWAVGKFVPERGLTLIYGPGGVGKTWLALCIAKAVSTGTPFLGLQTKQKPVFYIDRENPWPMLLDRVRKMDIRDVRFWHLSFAAQPPKLDAPEWEIYKSLPTGGLVIFDTCRSFHDGDENNSQDAALVMGHLKELRERDNTIVLLHHTPRSSERTSKGSTAWEDLADQALAFHRVRRGSLKEIKEEIESAEFDPDALYQFGTGRKTRYEPAKFYLTADFEAGGFTLAEDPEAKAINTLAEYIAGEGGGQNQSEIIAWAKSEGIGPRKIAAFCALLNRGEREGRWRSHRGLKGAKFYEPLS